SGGRLARSLQADQHHHRWRNRRQLEPFAPLAEHRGELFVDDLDELLGRRDTLELSDSDGLRFDALKEFARERERHVCFEQNAAHFAETFLYVGFCENTAAAQLREGVLEF